MLQPMVEAQEITSFQLVTLAAKIRGIAFGF